MSIDIARLRKADWILHLDADEILIPSRDSKCKTIQSMLCKADTSVQSIRFYNLEAVPEDENVVTPFEVRWQHRPSGMRVYA